MSPPSPSSTRPEPTLGCPEATPDEVRAAMEHARSAFAQVAEEPLSRRQYLLARLRRALIRRMDIVEDALVRATGKASLEALAGDIMVTVDTLHYLEGELGRVLRPAPRRVPLIYRGCKARVEHRPLGVVLVIAPWNYPLQLSLVPAVTALAAGNAVIIKPSEITPQIGPLIQDLWAWADGPRHLLQVVQGGPDVGRLLVEARPDKVFFTGSVATGRKVMAAAAQHPIPVELELGGKDPMLVFADARLDRAVAAALYGAFSNAGQACVSVERCYVERSIHEAFCRRIVEQTLRLRPGTGPDADLGPIIREAQVAVIEAHIDDALAKGARLLTPRRREGRLLWPIVLDGVTHDMAVMTEETFGPVLPIMAFSDEDEAVAFANHGVYGLGASIFTEDRARANRVAARLRAGSVALNDVIKQVGIPDLPFGGIRQSGFGRYHGPEGLLSFSQTVGILDNRSPADREVNWFPYTRPTLRALRLLLRLRHGDGPASIARTGLARVLKLWS